MSEESNQDNPLAEEPSLEELLGMVPTGDSMAKETALEDEDLEVIVEEPYVEPTEEMVYCTPEDDEDRETIFMIMVYPRRIREVLEVAGPRTSKAKSHSASEVVNMLVAYPDEWGVVYQVHDGSGTASQKQALRLVADRVGLKLKIEDLDPGRWLVTIANRRDKYRTTLPEMKTPQQVYNIRLENKRRKQSPFFPTEPAPYKPYLKMLQREEVLSLVTGRGLLYPISVGPIVNQQARLHNEARRLGLRVSVVRWDEMHFLLRTTDLMPEQGAMSDYKPPMKSVVKRPER